MQNIRSPVNIYGGVEPGAERQNLIKNINQTNGVSICLCTMYIDKRGPQQFFNPTIFIHIQLPKNQGEITTLCKGWYRRCVSTIFGSIKVTISAL